MKNRQRRPRDIACRDDIHTPFTRTVGAMQAYPRMRKSHVAQDLCFTDITPAPALFIITTIGQRKEDAMPLHNAASFIIAAFSASVPPACKILRILYVLSPAKPAYL